jgi:hypothetical protein
LVVDRSRTEGKDLVIVDKEESRAKHRVQGHCPERY